MPYGKTPTFLALKQNFVSVSRSKGYLRCLTDANGHKMAQRIYLDYISDSDFSRFPAFLVRFDKLLTSYGAKSNKAESIKEDKERKAIKKRNKDKE